MGTPDFAVPALRSIVESSPHQVISVYSQPPRPSGRGQKLTQSPIHAYADSQNIPVYTPLNFKADKDKQALKELEADVAVVAAYGLILPQSVLDTPRYGCLNIHASLLPRWRGASPIQQSIWKGDQKSGVTIMQMEKGLDTGPMIAKEEMAITAGTTAQSLHDSLSQIGGTLILDVLGQLADAGVLNAEKQDDRQTCYAPMLKKEDGLIDWQQSAQEIDQQIRALNPWPGTYTHINGQPIKILSAEVLSDKADDQPGTILDKTGAIACGDGQILQITMLKPQNAKAMDFVSALNGGYFEIASKFA